MTWKKAAWAAFVLAFLICALPARAADVVYPPGLRVGLVPPPGMIASERQPGFVDAERKDSIAILDLPGTAYYTALPSIFDEKSNRQVVVEKRELLPFGSGIGHLVSGHADRDGVRVRAWLLLAHQSDLTAIVTVFVPDEAKDAYPETLVRKTLASVRFRPAPLDEQLTMLPFKVTELAGFRVVQLAPGAAMLTDGPSDRLNVDQPHLFVTAGSGAPPAPADRARFAQQLIGAMPGFTNLRFVSSEPLRFGGQIGYEVRAEALDAQSGTPVSIVQWLRLGSGGFLRIVGIASNTHWPLAYPKFRAIRDGIEPR